MSQRVTIDPVTRLEGHGRIEIFLDDAGEVADVYFQVPELRGFEAFVVGRPVEDMPVITNRICGVCPEAHHMAATKALDDLFMVTPPPAALTIRELFYMAFFVADHATHFYALGGPDLVVGPDAPPRERNILGVVAKVGGELAGQFIAARKRNHAVIERLGGRSIHPAAGVPGGWSRAVHPSERRDLVRAAEDNVSFALATLRLFDELVLADPAWRELMLSDSYLHRTYSMGTVDAEGRPSLYDGQIRVVDPDGKELVRYASRDYAAHLAERVEPHTYLKLPYLKQVGWRGLVDGKDSGVYAATPLTRLNVGARMATPLAEEHRQRLVAAFAGAPVHHRLATHWARLVELLYAAERMLELARDPGLCDPRVRVLPSGELNPQGGVGSVEAPRGTLTHHYEVDPAGRVTRANLIVGTTNNHAVIAMSLKRAAEKLIHGGHVIGEGLLNRIEMAFRLYDPCLSCATHALPGQMPLVVTLRDARGAAVSTVERG